VQQRGRPSQATGGRPRVPGDIPNDWLLRWDRSGYAFSVTKTREPSDRTLRGT